MEARSSDSGEGMTLLVAVEGVDENEVGGEVWRTGRRGLKREMERLDIERE